MFSMSALASIDLDAAALARLGVLQGTQALLPERSVLSLNWPELERALPDRGLPRGVIEIAAMPRLAPHRSQRWASHAGVPESMRGGATSIAIAAVSALQASDDKAWCAWITPSHVKGRLAPFLYAPALARAGVDLERLLVVRPPPQALARTVVKAAASGAFGLLVIDVPQPQDLCGGAPRRDARGAGLRPSMRFEGRNDGGAMVVRKLALAAEESGTTSLLLTSALASRALPWPVALRIEVERRSSAFEDALAIRITKDRRGAASSQHVVRLAG